MRFPWGVGIYTHARGSLSVTQLHLPSSSCHYWMFMSLHPPHTSHENERYRRLQGPHSNTTLCVMGENTVTTGFPAAATAGKHAVDFCITNSIADRCDWTYLWITLKPHFNFRLILLTGKPHTCYILPPVADHCPTLSPAHWSAVLPNQFRTHGVTRTWISWGLHRTGHAVKNVDCAVSCSELQA